MQINHDYMKDLLLRQAQHQSRWITCKVWNVCRHAVPRKTMLTVEEHWNVCVHTRTIASNIAVEGRRVLNLDIPQFINNNHPNNGCNQKHINVLRADLRQSFNDCQIRVADFS